MFSINMRLLYILFFLTLQCLTASAWGDSKPKAAQLKAEGDKAFQQGNFTKALEKFTYAMQKAQDEPDDDTTYIRSVGNISIIYSLYDDVERSLYYIEKAYNYAVKTKNYTLQSRSVINMVGMSCSLKDLEKAKYYYSLEKELAPKDKDQDLAKYYLLYNDGMIAQLKGNYTYSIKQHEAALNLAISKKMDVRYNMGQYLEIGKCYLHLKDYDKALTYTRLTLRSCRFVPDDNNTRILAYKQMEDIFTAMGQRDSANYYTTLRTKDTDTKLNMREFSKAKDILMKYEQQESDRRNRRQIILTTIIIAIIIALVTYLVGRILNHRKMRLQREAHQREIAILEAEHQKDMESKQSSTRQTDNERTPIGLPTRQVELLCSSIEEVMAQTDIITSPDFSLKVLTEKVKSNTKYVSWVINEKFGMNFKQLLNRYRIEEAARRLRDTDGEYANFTIEAIAHSVGFNSQSSFIEAFKTIKKVTPSQFKALQN